MRQKSSLQTDDDQQQQQEQAATTKAKGCPSRDKRSSCAMSKRIQHLLQTVILPLAHEPGKLRETTHFTLTEKDALVTIFDTMRRDCPNTLANRECFLKAMGGLYDEYRV